jgi:hypothetical protein
LLELAGPLFDSIASKHSLVMIYELFSISDSFLMSFLHITGSLIFILAVGYHALDRSNEE